MTTGEQLFLLLAEEKSFHRAAEKAFITQQCLSDHIRRLEEKHGTALFTRRPRVELTAAGCALERMLRQLEGLERGLENELAELESGAAIVLRLGVNHTRAPAIVPALWQRLHARYPGVRLEVICEETTVMKEQLLRGKLDFFLGVNAYPAEPLAARTLANEELYLLATANYLRRFLGDGAETLLAGQRVLSASELAGLPLAANHVQSTTWTAVSRYAAEGGMTLSPVLQITNYPVLAEISRDGALAFFAPRFFAYGILRENAAQPAHRQLLALPLGTQERLRFELVYHSLVRYPRCALDCFDELASLVRTIEPQPDRQLFAHGQN